MSLETNFMRAIYKYPIIASLRSGDLLPQAISSKSEIILISSGDIFNVEDISREL